MELESSITLKTCLQPYACDSHDLYGDFSLSVNQCYFVVRFGYQNQINPKVLSFAWTSKGRISDMHQCDAMFVHWLG